MNKALKIKNLLEEKLKNDDFFINHCFIVGGFVRDVLLGNNPKDIDIVVNVEGGSEKLANIIHKNLKNITTNPLKLGNYPIWKLNFINCDLEGESIEIAETMSEEYPDKNSRQRIVKFSSLNNDILRRDFTINSLLLKFNTPINKENIIDISNFGINDLLYNKVIRCFPSVNSDEIFYVDPLRILRAIRFSIRYNWDIEDQTLNAMKKNANRLTIVSKERIINELKIISNYSYGILKCILILDKIDGIKYIFPEIANLKNVYQAPDVRNIHLEGSEFTCKNFSNKNE